MIYIDPPLAGIVFHIIREAFGNEKNNPVPNYEREMQGLHGYHGCLERVKFDAYYPDFYTKATQLFVSINHGHNFSNGNKRLALVTLLMFATFNGYTYPPQSHEKIREKMLELFPEFAPVSHLDYSSVEVGLLNVSYLVADSKKYGIEDKDLKHRVQKFLEYLFTFDPDEVEKRISTQLPPNIN